MNDIFKDMQVNVGCEYISDLPSYKRKVWHEMKRLNPADYEERQLDDFSKYVFGMSYQTLYRKKRNASQQTICFVRAFFIPEKNLKIFQKRSLNHTFHSLYGAERGINTFQIIVERG